MRRAQMEAAVDAWQVYNHKGEHLAATRHACDAARLAIACDGFAMREGRTFKLLADLSPVEIADVWIQAFRKSRRAA
jgi:hypothetical protein